MGTGITPIDQQCNITGIDNSNTVKGGSGDNKVYTNMLDQWLTSMQ